MSIEEPKCTCGGRLNAACAISLPSDSMSDEIRVIVLECGACGSRCVAISESSMRGRMDSDCNEYSRYKLDDKDVTSLVGKILKCPSPNNDECNCPTHKELGRQDANGRWVRMPWAIFDNKFL